MVVAEGVERSVGVLQMKKLAVNRVQEIQGFLTIAAFGADTDALIHTTSAVTEIQELVRAGGPH